MALQFVKFKCQKKKANLCEWIKKIEKWKNTQATAEVLDIFIKVCYNWLWFLEIDSEFEGND